MDNTALAEETLKISPNNPDDRMFHDIVTLAHNYCFPDPSVPTVARMAHLLPVLYYCGVATASVEWDASAWAFGATSEEENKLRGILKNLESIIATTPTAGRGKLIDFLSFYLPYSRRAA